MYHPPPRLLPQVNAAVGSYIDRNEELTLQGLLDINVSNSCGGTGMGIESWRQ